MPRHAPPPENRQEKKHIVAKKPTPRPITRAKTAAIYAHLRELDPEPKTELHYSNSYTLVVAVALSAQATDVGVNKATKNLFALADNPADMVALGEDKVRDLIKTIGLFRNKAKNVIGLSQLLLDEFDGEVPQTRDELIRLPGVGRKTANVVLNVAFGQPTIAVDTHIFRVGNRTGMAPGNTPDEVEAVLMRVTPPEFMQHAHHWLILHGRYTCVARKPRCWLCRVSDVCRFRDKTPAPDA